MLPEIRPTRLIRETKDFFTKLPPKKVYYAGMALFLAAQGADVATTNHFLQIGMS